MAEVIVTLNDIEVFEGLSKKNGKPYTRFTVKASDGRKYQTFRREIVEPGVALKGQRVVLAYTESQNGDYTNYDLDSIRSAPSEATIATETPSQGTLEAQPFPGGDPLEAKLRGSTTTTATPSPPNTDKDTSIARAVAFKGAVALAENGAIEIGAPDDILKVAESFVPWLLNGTSFEGFSDLAIASSDNNVEEPVDAAGELVKF